MFEYEQETYGSKGRERIRAAAMAHTGKKGKVLLPPTRRQKAEGLDKVEVDVCFESASSNFLVCSTLPTRRNKQHRITIHKSQGLTFDRCTVHTKTFAAGQLYVGLSRCSNIEGLTIFPKMEKNRLHASREVIDFYARMEKKASEGTVQLECPQRFSEQVKAYITDLLEKEKAAEKQAAPACSSAGEALPWEREDAPGRDYQSTWNQF